MDQIQCSKPTDAALARLLESHPAVVFNDVVSSGLEFWQGDWNRKLEIWAPGGEVFGLPELMDNNPLVCADNVSLPPPASTLALTALGPLFRAGLVLEPPVVQTNAPLGEFDTDGWWETLGWTGGVDIVSEARDMGTVLSAQAMAVVSTLDDWDAIDSLYEEAYGRTYYVRLDDTHEWHASLVENKPHAVYRIRLTPDEPNSLITVQVMADRNGKCGAAQMVHTFNVMAGFEEFLGIPDSFAAV